MKKRGTKIISIIFIVLIAASCVSNSRDANNLKAGFKSPTNEYRPHTWWHWMNGHISKEGITKDLEAMADAGIGAALMFDVSSYYTEGEVAFGTEEYYNLLDHAANEAKRLGMEFGIHNCNGWSSSGGPWVTPEHSMKKVVFSETRVKGSGKQTITLQPLEENEEWQMTFAVFALPVTSKEIIKLKNYRKLTGNLGTGSPITLSNETDNGAGAFAFKDIVYLNDKLNGENLEWEVPEGEWLIVRLGATSTGAKNHPARDGGMGLEVDKLSRESFDVFWDGFMEKVVQKMGNKAGKTFKFVEIDSFEQGIQNWTQDILKEFKKRRGYDPAPYLPALAGIIVENRDITERFLWDYRRTISDLLVENYDQYMAEKLEAYGINFVLESYHAQADNLARGGRADIPMGEFWVNKHRDHELYTDIYVPRMKATCKFVASVAHTYNKPIVASESFPANGRYSSWSNYPFKWKAYTDLAFINGINRHVFHRFVHQAYPDIVPGLQLNWWGSFMDKNNSFWPLITEFFTYIKRCQYILQQGHFVADAAYFGGEHLPVDEFKEGEYVLKPAPGYDFDLVSRELLLKAEMDEEGRLLLPGGMSYRALILPDKAVQMTEELAKKLEQLVKNGLRLYGPKPTTVPSLENYPTSETTVKDIAEKLWGSSSKNNYGKGVVISKGTFREVVGIAPDVSVPDKNKEQIGFIHRKRGDADIYFIANHFKGEINTTLEFRLKGRQPEIWHPETGKCEDVTSFTFTENGTKIPLTLEPNEAYFIVFEKKTDKDQPTLQKTEYNEPTEITSPWKVKFHPNHNNGEQWGPDEEVTFETLISWDKHPNEKIKYFSGLATYRNNFDFQKSEKGKVILDLGKVEVIAHIKLNGIEAGTAWTEPYQIDITDYLKNGNNIIEITVANLLINRLIGDEQYPESENYVRLHKTIWQDEEVFSTQHGSIYNLKSKVPEWVKNGGKSPDGERKTFAFVKFYKKDSPLKPSGLIGPVKLINVK